MHSVSVAANGLLATWRRRQIQMNPGLFDTEAHAHLEAGKSTFVRLLPIVGIGEGQARKLNGHEYHNGPMQCLQAMIITSCRSRSLAAAKNKMQGVIDTSAFCLLATFTCHKSYLFSIWPSSFAAIGKKKWLSIQPVKAKFN